MIKLSQAIVVEGKYDKNALRQLVDAPVFETNGFGVMKNRDGAGFVIRNYLKRVLPKAGVLHAYVPDVYGKERRKAHAGKEGKLGVEGMPPEILLQALRNAGAEASEGPAQRGAPIVKADLYAAGYSGRTDSAAQRAALLKELSLPEHMSSNALLDALNVLMTREEFLSRYGENHG